MFILCCARMSKSVLLLLYHTRMTCPYVTCVCDVRYYLLPYFRHNFVWDGLMQCINHVETKTTLFWQLTSFRWKSNKKMYYKVWTPSFIVESVQRALVLSDNP
jgi:hypothetical protein